MNEDEILNTGYNGFGCLGLIIVLGFVVTIFTIIAIFIAISYRI